MTLQTVADSSTLIISSDEKTREVTLFWRFHLVSLVRIDPDSLPDLHLHHHRAGCPSLLVSVRASIIPRITLDTSFLGYIEEAFVIVVINFQGHGKEIETCFVCSKICSIIPAIKRLYDARQEETYLEVVVVVLLLT